MDELVRKRSIALGMALDSSSHAMYNSALNSYINFCTIHNFPLAPTEDTFTFFAVYMSEYIDPRSVGQYLSGIVSKLEQFYPNARTIRNTPLVRRTLAGCRRLRSKPVSRMAPLSRDDLRRAFELYGGSAHYEDRLFLAMLYSGFRGLLRLGEMTMPDNAQLRNPKKYTTRLSVEWLDDAYAFWLPSHKSDRQFEGARIVLKTIDGPLDPTATFKRYIHDCDTHFPFHPSLWVTKTGSVPTREWFLRRLRILCPNTKIAGQSLRSGGATALAEDGVRPEIIQAIGRWASDTFHIYIRKNPVILQALLSRQPAPAGTTLPSAESFSN